MSSNNSTNYSSGVNNTSCPTIEDSVALKTAKTLAYCLLLLVSLAGNVLIVMVVYKDKAMRTTTNFMVVNMAISDLLVPVFAMPRAIVEIHFGNLRWLIEGQLGLALCKLTSFLQDISTAVSVQSLVLISFDRFYAVSRPLKAAIAKTKVKKAIPLIWFIAALIHACYLYGFQLQKFHGKAYCVIVGWNPWFTRVLFLFLMFAIYVVPLSINTTLYSLIVKRLRDQQIYGIPSMLFYRQRTRRNRTVLRMSVAIVVVFFLSMTPFVIYLSIELFSMNHCGSADFRFYSQYLVHCRGVLNFFTYVVFNQRYRRGFGRILGQCLPPCTLSCPNHVTYEVNSLNSPSTTNHMNVGTANKGFAMENQQIKLLQLTRLEF